MTELARRALVIELPDDDAATRQAAVDLFLRHWAETSWRIARRQAAGDGLGTAPRQESAPGASCRKADSSDKHPGGARE